MTDLDDNERDAVMARLLGLDPFWDDAAGWQYIVHPMPADPRHDYLATVPAYSTDIAAAWSVVERLHFNGWEMSLSVNDFITEPWDCRFFNGERIRVIHHGKTAPIAICRAAISALEAAQYHDHAE